MQEYDVEDLFNLAFVPHNTPLYFILTGGSDNIKAEGVLHHSIETLSVIREYLETGFIDIVSLFDEDQTNLDEIVDAFSYLLCLTKPDYFPIQYWFATLSENWILEQWSKENTPTNNKWLIDVTDLTYKGYEYALEIVNNPDYVVAGSYPLSLIDHDVEPGDIDVFYIGEETDFTAGDELTMAIRRPYVEGEINTVEDIITATYHDNKNKYFQYNDGATICHRTTYTLNNNIGKTTGEALIKWQFILKKYPSASHVLISFDIDCCKVCCIGDRVYASPCGYYAIKNKVIKLANNATCYDTLFRLLKYVKGRGYAVLGGLKHNIVGEYTLPDKMEKTDYYEHDLGFDELHTLLDITPNQKKDYYPYCRLNHKHEIYKYLPRATEDGSVHFISFYSRMLISFHQTVRSLSDLLAELDYLPDDMRELAVKLVNSYKWTIEDHEPRQPVDFLWYI